MVIRKTRLFETKKKKKNYVAKYLVLESKLIIVRSIYEEYFENWNVLTPISINVFSESQLNLTQRDLKKKKGLENIKM